MLFFEHSLRKKSEVGVNTMCVQYTTIYSSSVDVWVKNKNDSEHTLKKIYFIKNLLKSTFLNNKF